MLRFVPMSIVVHTSINLAPYIPMTLTQMLRKGLEEGSLSDEILEEIFKFSDFAVVKFLLNAILHTLYVGSPACLYRWLY